MKRMMCLMIAAALLVSLTTGCKKKVTVETGKVRLEALRASGVPETEMSRLKIYLYQMETSQKTGNSQTFRKYQDSLDTKLTEFESQMGNILEQAKAAIPALREKAVTRKATLKGFHLKSADSMLVIIDSLAAIPQPLDAKVSLEKLALLLDTLERDQKIADSLRTKFVGAWVTEKEPADSKYKAVERREIHLKKDGSLYIVEKMKGQSDEYTIQDWEFQSKGTWDIKGEMAILNITSEKRVRESFKFKDKTGKWKNDIKQPYDSTYTDGSKNRYPTFSTLKKDYKWFPTK